MKNYFYTLKRPVLRKANTLTEESPIKGSEKRELSPLKNEGTDAGD